MILITFNAILNKLYIDNVMSSLETIKAWVYVALDKTKNVEKYSFSDVRRHFRRRNET